MTEQLTTRYLACPRRHRQRASFFGQVVMITVESALRHTQRRREVVQFVQTLVAHQMTPAALTKPPATFVDVQSQRRRSLRTRTGIGFGAGWPPRTRAPSAPMPTAAPTTKASTIHEFMPKR